MISRIALIVNSKCGFTYLERVLISNKIFRSNLIYIYYLISIHCLVLNYKCNISIKVNQYHDFLQK